METKYPLSIMDYVRQNLGLESGDTSEDERINKMSHDEVLDRVAIWFGLINHGGTIRSWIRAIYKVELK